jgi:hypothetical protein
MPTWLVEGNPTAYFLVACAAFGCIAAWWRTRKVKYAIAGAVALCALIGLLVLDRFVESDREQMIRKVQEIAAAISSHDVDRAFTHVSDRFDRAGVRKSTFRSFAESRIRSRFVTDVQVWDFAVTEAARERRRGVVECFFKVRGSFGETQPGAFVQVVFTLDSDGQWRVSNFDWFSSITDSTTPMPIPGWGSGQ